MKLRLFVLFMKMKEEIDPNFNFKFLILIISFRQRKSEGSKIKNHNFSVVLNYLMLLVNVQLFHEDYCNVLKTNMLLGIGPISDHLNILITFTYAPQ